MSEHVGACGSVWEHEMRTSGDACGCACGGAWTMRPGPRAQGHSVSHEVRDQGCVRMGARGRCTGARAPEHVLDVRRHAGVVGGVRIQLHGDCVHACIACMHTLNVWAHGHARAAGVEMQAHCRPSGARLVPEHLCKAQGSGIAHVQCPTPLSPPLSFLSIFRFGPIPVWTNESPITHAPPIPSLDHPCTRQTPH